MSVSCDYLEEHWPIRETDETRKAVARVYESYLYEDALVEVLPKGLEAEDSLAFVRNFISSWAKNQLMVYKAEYNLPEEQKRFEEQIAAYRNDLLKHSYLQSYIAQRLDTNLSENEVRAFYEENPDQFQLKENILRVRYLVVPMDAPNMDKLKEHFADIDEQESLQWLQDYALRYARFFVLNDTNWVSFNQFSQQVPVQTYNQQEFLEKNSQVYLEQEPLVYFADILEYKVKDSPSPLRYVYPRVASTLINQRRLALIQELEQNLLSDAQKKNQFEIF